MEGITITCILPEENSGYDYRGYCENLIEKIKIIQTCEERKWNLEFMMYEKTPETMKTGYVTSAPVGEEERFIFIQDVNNERCPIITDTKEIKQCIMGDQNIPLIFEKTPYNKKAHHLNIKGYEVDYDDYTIKIGSLSSQGTQGETIYRNVLQVVYRPIVYRKDTIEKIEWFSEMLSLFFEASTIDIIKKQNSQPAEAEQYGIGKYLTQKYVYLQTYIRIKEFIRETKL